MTESNRTVRLASRPVGLVEHENFAVADEPIEEPGAGQFRVRVSHVSIDPAMRGWINPGQSYVPPVGIGDVMRAIAVGEVVASSHDQFAVGDWVTGLFDVQRYAISDGAGVAKIDIAKAPPERWIAGLGMPGQTAYFGLLDVGRPKPGETVLVSAASGAVGSIVGQIAKIVGCRAVGIAGGPDKCRALTEDFGFDAAVDYKSANFLEELAAACPDGVDVYFENVGGKIFDAALNLMNTFGRIPICGMISVYNDTSPPVAPSYTRTILVKRLTIQGFIIFDYRERYPEAVNKLATWHAEGRLKLREDVRRVALDAYPDILNELFSGANNGKLVMELA